MTVQTIQIRLTPEAISLIDMQLYKASVNIENTFDLADKLDTIRMDIEAQTQRQLDTKKV